MVTTNPHAITLGAILSTPAAVQQYACSYEGHDPIILTKEQMTAAGVLHAPDVRFEWSSSNDGYAVIHIDLHDTGDVDEPMFDVSYSVDNSDNVHPIDMVLQLAQCVKRFYELGFQEKYKLVGG